MRAYLEDTKRLFTVLSKHLRPVIYHSEADSWTFVQWLATDDTHDGRPVPRRVKVDRDARRRLPARTRSRDSPARLLGLRDRYARATSTWG